MIDRYRPSALAVPQGRQRQIAGVDRIIKLIISTLFFGKQCIGRCLESRPFLLKKSVPNLRQHPERSFLVGFQVVGYDEDKPKIIVVQVGRSITLTAREDEWICWTGQPEIVEALYENYRQHVMFRYFSLQDAIDHAQFLIRTTAEFQRFANQIPTVGGAIDVGLVTPFHGFRWVHQKPLNKILGERL